MELRKGYIQTDVGIIPDDWIVEKVMDFTEVSTGGTPSTFNINYWNGEIKWMNSGELHKKKVYDVENRITELGLNNSAANIIPENCILIGLAGQGKTRGTVAINKVKLCTNQSIGAILPCSRVFYEYLYFNLDARYDELRGLSTGDGGRGGLNLDILKNLKIPFPPTLAEQYAIATALSDTDALITSLEKLIEKKRLIKQGAMQELLTGKKRLPGFSGKWEKKKLGKIANIKTGKKNNDDKNENGIYPFYVRSQNVERINSYSFDGEAILVPGEGNIGSIYHYINGKFDYHQRVYKISDFIDSSSGKYVFYYMKYIFSAHAFTNSVKATVDSLRLPTFLEFEIFMPSTKDEQSAIALVLSDLDAEIESLERKLEKYRLIKQGMMQELLTGKTRLV